MRERERERERERGIEYERLYVRQIEFVRPGDRISYTQWEREEGIECVCVCVWVREREGERDGGRNHKMSDKNKKAERDSMAVMTKGWTLLLWLKSLRTQSTLRVLVRTWDQCYSQTTLFTCFVRGSITVRLTSCLTGLDSAALLILN